MILSLILACEIGFWVFLVAGLVARYLLGRRRLGAALLAAAPVVDVVLLAAVAVDLRGGATATVWHGVAAIYIGISVMHGHAMIRWADERFAHRFAGGPPPVRLDGGAYARVCWRGAARTGAAMGIAALLLAGLIAWADDAARTGALSSLYPTLAYIAGIDALFAASYTIWPRSPRRAGAPSRNAG